MIDQRCVPSLLLSKDTLQIVVPADGQNEEPETIQTHLVPFWTVIMFSAHRWHLVNATDGTSEIMPRGENHSDVSFSVAAVDEDHWCQ